MQRRSKGLKTKREEGDDLMDEEIQFMVIIYS